MSFLESVWDLADKRERCKNRLSEHLKLHFLLKEHKKARDFFVKSFISLSLCIKWQAPTSFITDSCKNTVWTSQSFPGFEPRERYESDCIKHRAKSHAGSSWLPHGYFSDRWEYQMGFLVAMQAVLLVWFQWERIPPTHPFQNSPPSWRLAVLVRSVVLP